MERCRLVNDMEDRSAVEEHDVYNNAVIELAIVVDGETETGRGFCIHLAVVAELLHSGQCLKLDVVVSGSGEKSMEGTSSWMPEAAVQTTELCLGKKRDGRLFLRQEEPRMPPLADDRNVDSPRPGDQLIQGVVEVNLEAVHVIQAHEERSLGLQDMECNEADGGIHRDCSNRLNRLSVAEGDLGMASLIFVQGDIGSLTLQGFYLVEPGGGARGGTGVGQNALERLAGVSV